MLVDAPSKYTAAVQQLGLVLRNMQHVLSAARPYQARATLAHMLKQVGHAPCDASCGVVMLSLGVGIDRGLGRRQQ